MNEKLKTEADESYAWRRFVTAFVVTLVTAMVLIFAFIIVMDPYDSGHILGYRVFGVLDENPRTADASRGRDPQFNSAIIGNSRGQLLDPGRLSRDTGLSFVQLTVPGTGPREQLALLSWFAKHHSQIGAIVLVADPTWCSQNPALPLTNPFPFWLYTDSVVEYSLNVFNSRSLDLAWRRILLWSGLRTRSRADGYWDYESGRTWNFTPKIPDNFVPALMRERDPSTAFPAIERLQTALANFKDDTAFAIVMPPAFFSELPRNDDPKADLYAQCKGALAAAMGRRPHGAFLDFEIDGDIARNPENFMDALHYRAPIARRIEGRITSALASWK